MTSINTNIAAQTALRTLQSTNTQLDETQSRISTGLKIGEAKDNAAYWSITTTLKSDNKALGTVSEALGLGAATVDTAYQGLNATIDVLNEIKAKITAASQDGVDKTAVQAEIAELQKQLSVIATSSTFSGENWLSVDSDATGYISEKQIVSSMDRDANDNVTLATIKVDTTDIALIDASTTKAGILDAGKVGNAETGGLADMVSAADGVEAVAATEGTLTQTAAFELEGFDAGDYLTIAYDLDGANSATEFRISLDSTNGDVAVSGEMTIDELVAAFNTELGSDGVASKTADGRLVITSAATGATSEVELTTAAVYNASTGTTASASAGSKTLNGLGTSGTSVLGEDAVSFEAAAATMTTAFSNDIELDADDKLTFSLAVDGAEATTVTIDRATVIAALPSSEGVIASAADFVTVINQALENAGLDADVVASASGTDNIVFTSQATSGETSVQLTGFEASKGVNILTLSVSGASKEDLTDYLEGINKAIDDVTGAAATLGAVAARIELQQSFVSNLMDTIDAGVSGLVDADMNEESTRLQALQVKQQLGVQALSIANQSAQNVLRLFQ